MEGTNKAIIAGANGLVGSNLLNILLEQNHYTEILALVRKDLGIKHPKLTQLIVDFNQLTHHREAITGHALFCCIGTTRSKTPSMAAYYKIDHDYPVELASIAQQNNMPHYHLVSAIGADKDSSNYYSKIKGQTEFDIKLLNIKCLHIWRPSFLAGKRSEFRLFEKIALVFMDVIDPFLSGKFKKYRSIPAKTVTQAMYNQSLNNNEGVFIHPSDKIVELA